MLKSRLTYAAVMLVLVIFIFLRDDQMTYQAFYAALILPIFSFIMGYVSSKTITIKEVLSDEFVMKNETTEYKVQIHNGGFLPCFFAYMRFDFDQVGLETDVSEIYLAIKPFAHFESKVKISGKYRGIYEVNFSEFVTYDFLGLFKFKSKHPSKLKLTIAPQLMKRSEQTPDVIQQGEMTAKRFMKGQDPTFSVELRAYQLTDHYKQIHWKATAKRNTLISKNPEDIEQLTTVFFVDNLRLPKAIEPMLAREDQLIDRVVSVMSHCHQLGHRMFLQALNHESTTFTTDLTRLYHELAVLPFGQFGEIHDVLNGYLNGSKVSENVFLFTQVIDDALLLALQAFKFLGMNVTVFLFGTGTRAHLKTLESLNIHYICT
ncbi:MAG: DUF58 domain-containing protein [Defluviitaleaceae bacterium]|nr:DUF58 domain-containing protein [Defluviitaleaceae bacterium]